MAGTDFDLAINQEILRWMFGKTTGPQPVLPLHNRWLAENDATSTTPGTEVSAGAASRVNLNYSSATGTQSEGFSIARSTDQSSGHLIWSGPSTLITGNEIWDSSTPPRRICYDTGNFGFNVNTGDALEWDNDSSGIALQMMGFEPTPVGQALNWALGRTSGWTRPQGPFKIKLKQYDDLQYGDGQPLTQSPKSVLEAAPMQTVTFGAVTANGDNQAMIKSDVSVVFPVVSETVSVFVQGYEIWDSSSTPRKLCTRKPGQDYVRDNNSFGFVTIPAGNTLTIPLGELKLTLGRGDV